MHVDVYERVWMWAAAVLIALFLGAIAVTAGLSAIHPPSHVETVNPAALDAHPDFAEPKVTRLADGRVIVTVVAGLFSFTPDPIEVPAGAPVTFRLTSRDVLHGFHVVGTSANVMVVPGYVSQFTYTFRRPGEHVIACNEYCGLAHHAMVGKLVVTGGRP